MVFDLEWAQNRAQAVTPNLAVFSLSSLPFVVPDNGYRREGDFLSRSPEHGAQDLCWICAPVLLPCHW
jgi:hypothetical protein